VARAWLARWMPRTRLLVLVRNPSQRAYSHVNMGKEWMASKCTRLEERARMEPIQDLLTFDALMERSLIQTHWKSCADRRAGIATPSSFKWLRMSEGEIHAVKAYRTLHPLAEEAATEERLEAAGQVVRPLPASGAAMWDCLREHDASLARKHERELLGEWPSVSERPAIDGGVQLLGQCVRHLQRRPPRPVPTRHALSDDERSTLLLWQLLRDDALSAGGARQGCHVRRGAREVGLRL
jgi:hypothetical protein